MTKDTPSPPPEDDSFTSIGEAARSVFLVLALATMKFADEGETRRPGATLARMRSGSGFSDIADGEVGG